MEAAGAGAGVAAPNIAIGSMEMPLSWRDCPGVGMSEAKRASGSPWSGLACSPNMASMESLDAAGKRSANGSDETGGAVGRGAGAPAAKGSKSCGNCPALAGADGFDRALDCADRPDGGAIRSANGSLGAAAFVLLEKPEVVLYRNGSSVIQECVAPGPVFVY